MRKKYLLKVWERILLHLMEYSQHSEDCEVSMELTQEGIAKYVKIERSHVPRAVKKLKKMGYVDERRARIKGKKRSRMIYYLTLEGNLYAEALRRKIENSDVLWMGKKVKILDIQKKIGRSIVEICCCIEDDIFHYERLEKKKIGIVDYTFRAPNIERFYCRENEIEKIRKFVDEGRKVISIYGISGIGKTALALKYISEQTNSHIYWYQIRKWDTLSVVIRDFSLFLDEIGRPRFKRYLSANVSHKIDDIRRILHHEMKGKNIIIVYDDLHNANENLKKFMHALIDIVSECNTSLLIITSREVCNIYSAKMVVSEKIVGEIHLEGLDENCSKKLAGEIGETSLWSKIWEMTKGHPLFIEIIREMGHIEGKDVMERYIYEEVFKNLNDDEKEVMFYLSVHGYPLPKSAFSPNEKVVDSLTKKSLIKKCGLNLYMLHESMKEFFYEKQNAQKRIMRHEKAAHHYLKCMHLSKEVKTMESMYHFIMSQKYDDASEILIKNAEELMNKGYGEQILNEIINRIDFEKLSHETSLNLALIKSDILKILGRWNDAFEIYDDVIKSSKKDGYFIIEAKARIGRSDILRERSFWADAESDLKRVIEIAESEDDYKIMANAYRGMGWIAWRTGCWEESKKMLKKAIRYAEICSDEKILCTTYIDLGNLYDSMGNRKKGKEYYRRSLKFAEKIGSLKDMARLYNNLGTLYFYSNDWDEALRCYRRSIDISQKIGDIQTMGYAMANVAQIYIKNDDLERALPYLKSSTSIFENLNDKYMISTNKIAYGIYYRYRKDYQLSENHFDEGIEMLKELNMPYDIAEAYYERGLMYRDKGATDKSIMDLQKAIEIYEEIGAKSHAEKVDIEMKKLCRTTISKNYKLYSGHEFSE